MPSTIATLKDQWRAFKHDEPGERFQRQHDRMQQCSHGLRVAQAIAGGILTLAGIVLLFIPGPGLLVMLFGLALLVGLSSTLASLLDRAEPALRREAARMHRGWRALTGAGKVGIGGASAPSASAVALGLYGLVT